MTMTTAAEVRERLAYACGYVGERGMWDVQLAGIRARRRTRRSETERAKLGARSVAIDLGVWQPRVLELMWFRGFGARNVSLKYRGRPVIKVAVSI